MESEENSEKETPIQQESQSQPQRFSDVQLSERHGQENPHNEQNDIDDSDSDIDAEAILRNRGHRPSFTIGSDSDSASTASEQHQGNKWGQTLKTIPSAGTFSNGSGDGDHAATVVMKPGFLGGSSSRPHLHRSPTPNSGERNQGHHHGQGDSESYAEIHLFSSDESTKFTTRQKAPFYPFEAENKGASATEYGIVFGCFELIVFLISPVYGQYINRIGPRTVFNLGIFVTGASSIAFGFLDDITDHTYFIGLSILIRIVEALGEAAFITASFAIIAMEFPNTAIATTFAIMETFYGIGLVLGPLAGGALYELAGFTLPFATIGSLLVLSSIFTTFVMTTPINTTPTHRRHSNTSPQEMSTGFEMFSHLINPAIALSAFSIFCASASISYLNATLEPHMREFSLSPSPLTTGAIFIVNGGVYALSSPLWGLICEKFDNHLKLITVFGCGLICIGVGLIGPVPFVPLDTTLWGIIAGQAIQGLGLGAVLVAAFVQSLKDSRKSGHKDEIQTYILCSGVWTSAFALGAFVGPIVSGILFDIVGFRAGILSIIGAEILVVILVILSMCCSCCTNGNGNPPKVEESSLLLERPGTSREIMSSTTNNSNYGSV